MASVYFGVGVFILGVVLALYRTLADHGLCFNSMLVEPLEWGGRRNNTNHVEMHDYSKYSIRMSTCQYEF